MVINWYVVGKLVCWVVCEIVMWLVFSGLCSIFSMCWLNFGSLLRNSILRCVSVILFGCGGLWLFISVVVFDE